jgi:hypothetical protein
MNLSFDALRKYRLQLGSDLNMARGMLSFVAGLRGFFREQVTLQQANETLKRSLDQREQAFLDLVRTHVYCRTESPYLKLFRMAGCDFADLETHVRRRGLEKSLQKLAEEGGYLTADEFRGKKDVIRGGQRFRVSRKHLEVQDLNQGMILTQSSGTKNQPLRHPLSLGRLEQMSVLTCIFLSAHDLLSHTHAIYDAILPASGGIRHLLRYAKCGTRVDSWYAPRVPMNDLPEAAFHYLMMYLVVMVSKLCAGTGVPWPQFLDRRDPRRIVHWAVEKMRSGESCCVRTVVSNAVRVAHAAKEMGVSLKGSKFIVSGEPLTEFKRAIIEEVGASAIPCYGCGGLSQIAYGCGNPRQTDDVHVSLDILAVIQQPRPIFANGLSLEPFLFTTLSPDSSLLHINAENGDFGVIESRSCGCALDKAGLFLHLHKIRSFEKLTSEGMSYFYGDLEELLEKTFPAEFGGSPGDYQLVEEEGRNGQTLVTLLVHPQVGGLDEERLLGRLRSELSKESRNHRFITGVWDNAGTLSVKRKMPYATSRGKILPLHVGSSSIQS